MSGFDLVVKKVHKVDRRGRPGSQATNRWSASGSRTGENWGLADARPQAPGINADRVPIVFRRRSRCETDAVARPRRGCGGSRPPALVVRRPKGACGTPLQLPLLRLAEYTRRTGRQRRWVRRREVANQAREGKARLARPEEQHGELSGPAERAPAMRRLLQDLQEERQRLAEEIEQRRRAEEYARSVIDSALDAVISMDTSGRIVDWNAQAESIFGWTHGEAAGRELAALLIPPELRDAHRAGLARYLKTGEGPVLGQRLELTALRKDGTEFPVELSVIVNRLDDTVLFNAFLRDITQRGEDAAYRARMAALVDSSYDAIIGKDVEGRIISWNAGAERVYGYREDEAVGNTIAIILPPDLQREEPEIRHAMLTGQRLEQFEAVRQRKDGQLIPVSLTVSPIADDNGAIIGSSAIERDVTDRKQAETAEAEHNRVLALRGDVSSALAADQTLRAALQQCTEALVQHLDVAFARIWTLNEPSDTLELQASAGLYTHLDGPHSRIKMGEYKIGRIARNRQPHLTNDVPNDPNISSPDWAQREAMVAFAGYPLLIGNRVLGVVAMFARRKLSQTVLSQLVPLADGIAQYLQRKRNEEELRHAMEAAEQAVRARAEFLANVSHELRTPMNAIIGMTRLALDEELSDAVRDYLQTANDSAHSLLNLLNDILDFSKLESGKFTVERQPFPLRETVQETVKALSARAFEKGLELACEIDPDAPDNLVGDALRLRQVLTNLIGNAIKFTEQGEVVVSVKTLRAWPQGARLRFAVRDTGMGISPADQQRILEPFTQADASSTRHHGGTGLGLAICNELLQLMGGQLSVESEPGQGSCFSFKLALARAPAPATDAAASPAPQQRQPGRAPRPPAARRGTLSVLLAEDTPANQKVVTSMLEKRGHSVTVAENGREAVEWCRQQNFDVVLMDVQMPIMDGLQATAAIREQEKNATKSTPIVALTARAMRGDREKCLRAGMDAYISKPIDVDHLIELLESVAAGGRDLPSAAEPHDARRVVEPACAAGRPAEEGLVSSPTAAVIDFAGTMRRLAGDRDLFHDFIGYFDEDWPQLLAALREAIAQDDAPSLQRAAHSLKSLAANFGAERCVAAAYELELAGKSGDLNAAGEWLPRLEQEVTRLDAALRPYRPAR